MLSVKVGSITNHAWLAMDYKKGRTVYRGIEIDAVSSIYQLQSLTKLLDNNANSSIVF